MEVDSQKCSDYLLLIQARLYGEPRGALRLLPVFVVLATLDLVKVA